MARVKNGLTSRKRRKKVLKQAKVILVLRALYIEQLNKL